MIYYFKFVGKILFSIPSAHNLGDISIENNLKILNGKSVANQVLTHMNSV